MLFRFNITIPKEYFNSIEYYMKGISYDLEDKIFKEVFHQSNELDYIIIAFKKTGINHNVDMSVVIYSKGIEVYYVTYSFDNPRDILSIYNIVDIGLEDILLSRTEYKGLKDKLILSTINIETDVEKDADYYKDVVVNYEVNNSDKVKAILLNKNFGDDIELAQSIYAILSHQNIFMDKSDEYNDEFIDILKDKFSYFGYDEDYIHEPKPIVQKQSKFILYDYLIKALYVVHRGYTFSANGNLLSDFYNEYIDKLKYEGYFDKIK